MNLLSQAQRNRAAANRTRALKKRKLKANEVSSSSEKWVISQAPELEEDKTFEAHSGVEKNLDPSDQEKIKEQLELLKVRVAEKHKAHEERCKKEEALKREACSRANERPSGEKPEGGVSTSSGSKVLEAPEAESDREDLNSTDGGEEEEKAKEARRKECELHEQECREAMGLQGGTPSSTQEVGEAEPRPSPAPAEPVWDRVALQDLLELWEVGAQVVWPGGLDPLTTRRLLEGYNQRQATDKTQS